MHTPGHRDPFSPRNLLPRSPSFRIEYNDPIRPPATPKMPGVFPSRKEVDIQNAPIVTGKYMRPRSGPVFRGPDPNLTRPVPRNPSQPFPYINSESTQPITMDSLREPDMRGTPIPRTVPPVPLKRSASNEARRAITPELNQTRREARSADRLAGETRSNTLSTPRPEPIARDYFGEQRKNMEDLGMTELQPVSPGMATPQRPQVDESLLSRLPSRSERDRSSMQPGGMVSGDTFDAMAGREREARLAPQRALAQREDVAAEDNRGFTRTVDRNPESPTYGQAKVVGDPMFGPTVPSEVRSFVEGGGNLNSSEARNFRKLLNESREPRRKARLAGETYTDPVTGAVSDYGKFNEAREARQERKDDARELRTRRAQLMNYGRTGGVTVAPGGGIAGPMTVGTQATFGPNMSLNQATLMAQGQLDQENRLRDAEQRLQLQAEQKLEGDKLDRLAQLAPTNPAAADALASSLGIPKAPPSPEQVAANAQARSETQSVINEGGLNKGMGSMHRRISPNLTPEVTNEELDVLYEGIQLSPTEHLSYLEEQVAGMGMSEERANETLERKRNGIRIPPGAESNARNTLAQHRYLKRLREYVNYRQQS